MFCRHCGAILNDNAKFCTNCGKPLDIQPAAAPKPATPAPAQTPAPSPQPAANPYLNRASAPPKDRTGKYILKRAIFCGIALILGIVTALVLMQFLYPQGPFGGPDGRSIPIGLLLERTVTTLLFILVPLIIAFVIAILAGFARHAGPKNILRIIAAVLKSLTPFVGGIFLLYVFAIKLALVPLAGIVSPSAYIIPMFALTLSLTGFLIDAAVNNGHREGFAGGVAAAAAFAADKMPVIVLVELFSEGMFQIPGLGTLSATVLNNRAAGFAPVLIIYTVIIYVLKLIFDIISAAAAKGDPAPQVYASAKGSKMPNGLLIAGIIAAGIVFLLGAGLWLTAKEGLNAVDPGSMMLAPGQAGHVLGTDHMGRDFYTQLTYAFRNTLITGIANTIIAVILGIVFGLLMGFLKGVGSDVFKCITYVFGHGTLFAILLFICVRDFITSPFYIVGLFGWGSIAGAISGYIKTKKSSPLAKTSFMIPVLSQVVQIFCSAVILMSGLSLLGLGNANPAFPTLGYLFGIGRTMLARSPHLVTLPAVVMIVLLIAFHLLKAGLSSKEKRNY